MFVCVVAFRLQLRQHSFMKHRGKPHKWLDTTTGKVFGDDPSSSTSASSSTTATQQPSSTGSSSCPVPRDEPSKSRHPTARKSTSRSGIRVAMLRCGDFFSIRQCSTVDEDSPATSGTSAEASVDSGISQSDSAERISRPPLLCCHLCKFVCRSLTSFADHLQTSHHRPVSRRIRILTPEDPNTPRRCGFCPYESFSDSDFSGHMLAAHQTRAPVVCSVCREFASFRVSEVLQHLSEDHPDCSSDEFEELSAPYSVHRDADSSVIGDYVARDSSCTLSPVAELTDIADMSHVEFSCLLDRHAVWFDYWE